MDSAIAGPVNSGRYLITGEKGRTCWLKTTTMINVDITGTFISLPTFNIFTRPFFLTFWRSVLFCFCLLDKEIVIEKNKETYITHITRYIYNTCALSKHMGNMCMRLRNAGKGEASPSLFPRFAPNTHIYLYASTVHMYCIYPAILNRK